MSRYLMKIDPLESEEQTLIEFEADNDRSAIVHMRREALGRRAELWHEEAFVVHIARHAAGLRREGPPPSFLSSNDRAQLPGWSSASPRQHEEQRPHGWGWRKPRAQ